MKPWTVLAGFMAGCFVLSKLPPLVPESVWQSQSAVTLFGGLMFLMPVAGLFVLLLWFSRWQRRFHRRMRQGGLW